MASSQASGALSTIYASDVPLIPEGDESGEEGSDVDSAVGGLSYASSTTSARSEVYAMVEEFGRTYHGFRAGKYVMPNDEKERDRLDLQHALWTMTLDGLLHTAPLTSPRRVLDIATGTGIWSMEFAEQYASAQVLGTDLSPIQPSFVPINCTFEIADAEDDDWNFSHKFDYIHGRALMSCFADPRDIIRKAFEATEPGGYLEMQDGVFPFLFLDPQPPEQHPLRIFLDNCLQASRNSGRPWDNAQHYARWMTELGFVDVVEKRFNWPCGPWAKGEKMKKLGVYFLEDLKHAVPPICMKLFVKWLGWSEERVTAFLEELLPCLGAKGVHLYETVFFVQGRKPLDS